MKNIKDKINDFIKRLKKGDKKASRTLIVILVAVLASFYLGDTISEVGKVPATTISFNEFQKMANDKKVDAVSISIDAATFTFTDKDGKTYTTDNPRAEGFKKSLLESDIKVTEVAEGTSFMDVALIVIEFIFLIIVLAYFSKALRGPTKSIVQSSIYKPNDKKTRKTDFSSVAGNEEAKDEMKYLVDFLKTPKKYQDMGARVPKGVLFVGPPGTGKTLLARAIAGEANVNFYSVNGSDFVELYVGNGARKVRDLFTEAKKNAPCLVFIDEIDAIGSSRGIETNSERDQTLNALLSEIDGFNGTEGIVVLASTNCPEKLDAALIRPGRFDKKIPINLPDKNDRYEILKLYAQNKKFDESVNLENIAKMTIGFSGAGLESLMNEATILAVIREKKLIDSKDVDDAYMKIVCEGDKKKKPSHKDARELEIVAWHEAGHALCAKLFSKMSVPKVPIIPMTSGIGGVTLITPPDSLLKSKEELYGQIMVDYSGRIGEMLLLKDSEQITTGASSDINNATERIKRIITTYGMNDSFGMLNVKTLGVKDDVILSEASKLGKELYEKAYEFLNTHVDTLKDIADALLKKESIDEDELDEIVERHKVA